MSKLANHTRRLVAAATLAWFIAPLSSVAQSVGAAPFDAFEAFCDRQTFVLESLDEVMPWLQYFGGLRSAATQFPDGLCASTTVRIITNIVQSPTIEMMEGMRHGFLSFYISNAMSPDLGARINDVDGSFRYRNDIVLASFLWLLCPGSGEKKQECVKGVIDDFPADFVETSPVFCDFKEHDATAVEWPPIGDAAPLVCDMNGRSGPRAQAQWFRVAQNMLGE